MANPPVPNAAALEVRGLVAGQKVEITMGFQRDSPIEDGMLDALCGAIELWFYTECITLVPPQYTMNEVFARDLTAGSGLAGQSNAYTGTPGSSGTAVLPNNDTWTITFKTGLAGRSYRGRNYWPALAREVVVGSNILGSFANDVIAAYNALEGGSYIPGGWKHVVISYVLNKVVRAVGVTTPITQYGYYDLVLDSQRRRLPGRGK